MAAYTPTIHSALAATFDYAISFPYARVDDVRVYLNDVLIARGTTTSTWRYTNSGASITLGQDVNQQDGDALVIKRVTDITDAVTIFAKGAGFTAVDANAFINQFLYAIDELQVPAYDSGWHSVDTLVSGAVDIEYLHNLGAVPTRIQVQYKCTSAELGYEAGDVIASAETVIGGTFPVSTTAFTAHFENMADLTVQSIAGNGTSVTDSKWSYRILAWR